MTVKKTADQANCDVASLWLEHKEALFRFILKRVRDEDLAKDIHQEVLIKVYGFCMGKSGVGNVRSWLFQIAHNCIVDHIRKFGKVDRELPERTEEEDNPSYKEAEEFLLPILGFLPEAYGVPLRMSDIEGMKQADIAEKLGLNLSATKSRIQRGRQMLKEEFLKCCHLETDRKGNLISFSVKESCKPLQELRKEK
jgi:RNA polymerase sigma-70 factor, ECF subfamily